MFPKILKKCTFPLILCAALLLGAAGNLQAFSVDVDHLYYSDASREINYDFSSGTLGPVAPSPPNNPPVPGNSILLPDANPPIVKKDAADLRFTFGNIPDFGVATVTLITTAGVAGVTTTEGALVLQGSSQGQPPAPGTTWTYALTLKNFSGMTDPAKEYAFEIGFAVPTGKVTQPQIRGYWTSAGALKMEALIYDESTDQDLWTSGVIDLGALTPANTSLVLKMVNNGTTITFYYRLNGGAETPFGAGAYTIASGLVFNSLPARFPYLYLEEKAPESPFRVSSQHWKDNMGTGNSYYDAWLTVDDPGQATYSGITVASSGAEQNLSATALAFNPAGGYWEIPAQLFSDNFDDNNLDGTKWTTMGSAVTETGGILQVAQTVGDDIAKALSRDIVINPYAPIVVQRKAKVYAANNHFDGVLALYFGADAGVSQLSNTFSVIASHANNSDDETTLTANGFYIGKYAAHLTAEVASTTAVWDTWFDEKISYNPVSGVADLYIDNELKATYNVGALPAGATHMKVYLDAWGWHTGHYNYSDDLSVTQPWIGQPVRLISNSDMPPASPVTFTFEATKKGGGTETIVQPVTGYVTAFATNLLPTGDVSTTPVFSWNGVPGATSYGVQVSDANGNRLWNKYGIPPGITSVVYNMDGQGPALESGQTYYYTIEAGIDADGQHNSSFAQGSFTYNAGSGTPIAFNGVVKAFPSWPSIANAAAVSGADVSSYLPGTTTPIKTVTADAGTGAFSLTGIPKSTTFFLRVQPPTGYMPILSKLMNWTADIQGLLPFALFTTGQFADFGNAPGTSMIIGRVALENSPTTFLAGATIEAREWLAAPVPPATEPTLGATYPATYTSGTATQSDGIYMVKDIPAGKIVYLVATLAGHTFQFNGAIVPVAADAISEESFFATASPSTPSPFNVYSYHNQDGNYFINLFVEDPDHVFTGGVTVSGPGLSETTNLTYDTASKRWQWAESLGGIPLGKILPTGTRDYSFVAKRGSEVVASATKSVSVYVEGYATGLGPTGEVTTATPNFSWTGVSGATGYSAFLRDLTEDGSTVWSSPMLSAQTSSVVYNGSGLMTGHVYELTVITSNNTDGNSNCSFAMAQFTYTGGAAACTYALVPTSASPAAAGGSGTVEVAAGAGCAWTAVSNNDAWLHVTSGASGSGNGTVGYTADANAGAARTGTITIGGQTFTVNQAAAAAPPTITGLSSTTGTYGASLTITGTNFGTTQGQVLIGGFSSGVTIGSWSNTSITVNATRSGPVTVIAGGTTSSPSTQSFQIASPYFNVNLLNPTLKVIKNKKAEFLFGISFYNNFATAAGINLQLQGGQATALAGVSTFVPALPIKRGGGIVLKIDTTNLAAGTYTANIVATSAEQAQFDAGALTLEVAAVRAGEGIKFYELAGDNPTRNYFTSRTITKQGPFNVLCEVYDTNGTLLYDGSMPVNNPVDLTSSDPTKVLIQKDDFGYQFHAQENGTATITAVVGGVTATLPVTVNLPETPKITAIGLVPQTVTNKYEGTIAFNATGTGSIGYGTPGFLTMKDGSFDWANGNTEVYGAFKLDLTTPPRVGFYNFSASTGVSPTTAEKIVPLTITNDPSYAMIKGGVRPLADSMPFFMLEHFTLRFYDATTGAFAFAREYNSYTHNWPNYALGAVAPGAYKILYVPQSGDVKPQWWPNANVIAGATPVTFTAGGTQADIYFFARPQPVGYSITLGTPGQAFETGAAAEGSVTVTATDNTLWAAASDVPWITVSPSTGVGNGTVNYAVAANSGAARTGTITIGGQTFTVNQESVDKTPHPESGAIQSRFEAAMARFNANDFSEATGFAGYISPDFLDYGENKAQFLEEIKDEGPHQMTWTIQSIMGTGADAVMNLTWSNGEFDTLYFRKEGGVWLWYGNQHLFDSWANSGHEMYSTNPSPYWVSLSVEDPDPVALPGLTIGSVTVTGTDIPAGGIQLVHDETSGQWNSWSESGPDTYLRWAAAPTVPREYTFTIAYTGAYPGKTSPEVYTYRVMSFVEVAPPQGSLSPAANSTATRPLTFSWTSVGAGFRYRVEVNDASYNRLWETDDLAGASVAYAGPTLGAGQYYYNLITQDGYGNMSMVNVPFLMPPLKGDINGDGKVDLADAVLALRIVAGISPQSGLRGDYAASGTDVNGDNKVGLAEIEFILQSATGLRLQ